MVRNVVCLYLPASVECRGKRQALTDGLISELILARMFVRAIGYCKFNYLSESLISRSKFYNYYPRLVLDT